MSHFIISYAGNKRKEFIHFKNNINLDGIKNIIEPFCGTSAISFNLWLEHKDRFNYYLNDNSVDIYNIYKLLKDETPDVILNNLNNIKKSIKNKEDFNNLYKSKFNTFEFIVLQKMCSFRFGLYDMKKSNNEYKLSNLQLKFIEFIKCPYVYISNDDWFIPFDKYKDDANSLFFLDPPYLSLCNDFYQNKTINIYEYMFNNKIELFKSHIYLILENMWIIKLLFCNNNILTTYGKIYAISKKHTEHILIYNKMKVI